MKWNKQRAPGAAGPPPASLSPPRPAGLLPAAVFGFSGIGKIGNRRSTEAKTFQYFCFRSKVNLEGFRNVLCSSRNMYELVANFQKAVSLLISCFSLDLRGCERIKKRDEPGSFYTLEPDSWSPVRGKERGQATDHFPSMDTDISELSGH